MEDSEPDFIVDVSDSSPEMKWIKKPKEPIPVRKANFDGKILADADYFKKLAVVKPAVMLDDIGIFDEPERKLEPWTFKGVKWFRYRNYIWENDNGVKGDYAGRFDGKKIDASEGEPDIFK
jgi:hypothetical protein